MFSFFLCTSECKMPDFAVTEFLKHLDTLKTGYDKTESNQIPIHNSNQIYDQYLSQRSVGLIEKLYLGML